MIQGYWASVHRAQSEIRGKVDPDSPIVWIYRIPLSDRPIEGRGASRVEARTAFIERFLMIQKAHPELIPEPSDYDAARVKWAAESLEFIVQAEVQHDSIMVA